MEKPGYFLKPAELFIEAAKPVMRDSEDGVDKFDKSNPKQSGAFHFRNPSKIRGQYPVE